MAWLFVVLIGLAVVAVALVVVGRVTAQLAEDPTPTPIDLDDALAYVVDQLSDETTGQLSYEEVRRVLELHLSYLETKLAEPEPPPSLTRPAGGEDDASLAWVLGRIGDDPAVEVTDEQVVEILDAQRDYLARVGALRRVPRT